MDRSNGKLCEKAEKQGRSPHPYFRGFKIIPEQPIATPTISVNFVK